MSLAGLHAKRGMEFQDYVAIYYSLSLLGDLDRIFVQAESLNLPGSHSEVHVDDVVIGMADGRKVFIQVKMTAPEMKSWKVSNLHSHGELTKIFKQLSDNSSDIVELVCPHGFSELEALHRHIILYRSTAKALEKMSQSNHATLNYISEKIQKTPPDTADLVRRLQFAPRHDINGWERECLKLLEDIEDKDTALAIMLKLLISHQTKKNGSPSLITKSTVENALSILSRVKDTTTNEAKSRAWKYVELRRRPKEKLVPEIPVMSPHDELSFDGPRMELICRQKVTLDKRHRYSRTREDDMDIAFPGFHEVEESIYARTDFGICNYKRTKNTHTKKCALKLIWPFKKPSNSYRPSESNYRCEAFTHVFEDNEIWMLDSSFLEGLDINKLGNPVLPSNFEIRYVKALNSALEYYRAAKVSPPFEVLAKIEGIGNTVLELPDRKGTDLPEFSSCGGKYGVTVNFELHSYDELVPSALIPFFEEVYGLFLRYRPDYFQ